MTRQKEISSGFLFLFAEVLFENYTYAKTSINVDS